MSRKRSVSTEISTDPRVAELSEHGLLPVLLYTWAIPHADDNGQITGDARQFRLLVCPGLDVRVADVQEALEQIVTAGLLMWGIAGERKMLQFPLDAWYRHQSYIPAAKRRRTPQNAAEHREPAQITSSPSPSPSPSLTPTYSPDGLDNSKSDEDAVDDSVNDDHDGGVSGGDSTTQLAVLCGQITEAAHITGHDPGTLARCLMRYRTHDHGYLAAEAAKAGEWVRDHKGRKMTVRFLDNWLQRALREQEENAHGTIPRSAASNGRGAAGSAPAFAAAAAIEQPDPDRHGVYARFVQR